MKNNMTFVMVFNKLMNIAISCRYGLEGLEGTGMSERVALQSLICYGNATFFDYKKTGLKMVLPGSVGGSGFNYNGDPTSCWCWSRNGKINEQVNLRIKGGVDFNLIDEGIAPKFRTKSEGVMVFENQQRVPFIWTVIRYAENISDLMRSMETAQTYLKQPWIPICDESCVDSVKEFLKNLKNNDEVIPISIGTASSLGLNNKIEIVPLQNVETSLLTSQQLIEWYMQQFLLECILPANSQVDKKGENLTTEEINMNDDFCDIYNDSFIKNLEEQIDFVNEVLGTNIKVVDKRKVLVDKLKDMQLDFGGNDDETDTEREDS